MILTESAAVQKWCPHSRVIFNAENDGMAKVDGQPIRVHPPTHAATSYNRATNPVPLANCLGSKCMAWAWIDRNDTLAEIGADPSDGAVAYGHCGLNAKRGAYQREADVISAPRPKDGIAGPPAGPQVEVLPPQANGQAS